MKKAVYAGTFDPITLGHIDLIKRALKIFDKIIVAVSENKIKNPIFSLSERVNMVKLATSGLGRVEIEGFSSLTIDFLKEKKVKILIRGLRAVSDFEHEFHLAIANQVLSPEVETFFIMSGKEYSFISSALVKEILFLKGDVKGLVPDEILPFLNLRFAR